MIFNSYFLKKQLPVLLLVVVGIMAVRSSIIEPYRIPTRSMLPGLLMGDFLFASKLRYGFHIPFTESFFHSPIFLTGPYSPRRGDIIIFAPPEAGQDSLYIKRVIGLPGDRIQTLGKTLIINGSPVSRIEITGDEKNQVLNQDGFDPERRYTLDKLKLYRETIDNVSYLILEDETFDARRDPPEIVVPEENFFVMGDNRDDTKDSRHFGVISQSSIRGKAFAIWLSYRISFSDSNWSFRGNRIGKSIR